MSIDRHVCEVVGARWDELEIPEKPSGDLVFMKIQGKLSANASVIGLILDGAERRPVCVAKIPRNPACPIGIDHEYAAMSAIRSTYEDWQYKFRIPFEGFVEPISGAKVLFQRAAIGHSMVKAMMGEMSIRGLYKEILPWLNEFHRHNQKEVCLEGELLDVLVKKPIMLFCEKMQDYPDIEISNRLREYLAALPANVSGKNVCLVSQHGDFNAHNIILKSDGLDPVDFSVIDWEDFRQDQLPMHDLTHFFVSNSKLLDMKADSGASFTGHIIENGWYQNLFMDAVKNYESFGIISADLYWRLVPLYMVEMCLRLMDEQRKQEHTLGIWVSRANEFVHRFPLLNQ